jgi:hypothetical protein
MIERLAYLTIPCAVYGVLFGIYYFGWSRPTPGFVSEPFWDRGKIAAGLILAFVLALYVIFGSEDMNRRGLTIGFLSLASIWYADVMIDPTVQSFEMENPDTVRISGWVVHSIWAIFFLYQVLFGGIE